MHWFHIKRHTRVPHNFLATYVNNSLEKNVIYKDILELIVVMNIFLLFYHIIHIKILFYEML